jgi:FkbM family methyltransferase
MSLAEQIVLGIVRSVLKGVGGAGENEIVRAAHALARPRMGSGPEALAFFCRHYLAVYENCDYNIESNGERLLLQRLAAFRPSVVFDVGANDGAWLLAARTELPGAHFHGFEIIPASFAVLARNLAGHANVSLNAFGLSDMSGDVEMRVFAVSSKVASQFSYPHGAFQRALCPVRRGDEYMRDRAISRIDFLKIDVEGAEHLVLRGFERALDAGAIDVIQFEYGKSSIVTHFLLSDFHALLESKGYVVGKIYPEGVDFRPYELDDENFLGPNYLAVRRARPDLIGALCIE